MLERLNSVLEPARILTLAEKASPTGVEELRAADGFQFCATMNPGGDFGKKELSPALRNRFTEIWVGSAWEDEEDLHMLLRARMADAVFNPHAKAEFSQSILEFAQWFSTTVLQKRAAAGLKQFGVTLRELLTWVDFMNAKPITMSIADAFVHGGTMVLLDAMGMVLTNVANVDVLKQQCVARLLQISCSEKVDDTGHASIVNDAEHFGISPFVQKKNPSARLTLPSSEFTLAAPTTRENTLRVLRAMQLPNNKPILLEGSPGM